MTFTCRNDGRTARFILAFAFFLLAGPAYAVDVKNAYAWISPSGKSAAVYLTLTNPDTAPDRLRKVSSEMAKHAMLHETVTDAKGVTRMRHLSAGVSIASNSSVSLEPGGMHIMLTGFRKKPIPGENLWVHLQLESGASLRVPVIAEKAGRRRANQ